MTGHDITLITPETRVGALLSDFPELETVLLGMSPKFEKLKNPVLRKTVGKVATLRQVARVGDLPVSALVNRLRQAVGQKELVVDDSGDPGDDTITPPEWLKKERIVRSTDVRESIERGEQPISDVMKIASTLRAGEIAEIIAPFVPAPLIDLARGKGFLVHLEQMSDNYVVVFVCKSMG